MRNLLIISCFLILITSCKKDEGVGGNSTIKGKIFVKDYNGTVFSGNSYYGADFDVYIIYGGENSFYDDKVTTSYDGSFEFRYLRKGNYKVFVYSKDVTGSDPSGLTTVFESATINKNKEVIDLGDLQIND